MKETPQIKEAISRYLALVPKKELINPISVQDIEVISLLIDAIDILGAGQIRQVLAGYKVDYDTETVENLTTYLAYLSREVEKSIKSESEKSKPPFFHFINSKDSSMIRFRDIGVVRRGEDRKKGPFIEIDGTSNNAKPVLVFYNTLEELEEDYMALSETIS